MNIQVKHSISFLLAFLFLMPSGIKLADAFFHNHTENQCFSKNIEHFHVHDVEDCDIVGIHYSSFVSDDKLAASENISVENSLYNNLYISYKEYNKRSYFSLRAPPSRL